MVLTCVAQLDTMLMIMGVYGRHWIMLKDFMCKTSRFLTEHHKFKPTNNIEK